MTLNYLTQQEQMPPLCDKNSEAEVKKDILKKLSVGELAYLSHLSPEGWPITDCMHYANVADDNDRPIIYMFTHPGRKMDNIEKDPRVSVSIANTISYEQRNETWAFQFKAIAVHVTDQTEIDKAISTTREKAGYEFAKNLPLEEQPQIKIIPLFGSWVGNGNPCSINYGDAQI